MTFLQLIAEEKRSLVKEKKKAVSLEKLRQRAETRKKRAFYTVFHDRHGKEVKIIAEIKKASPSRGILRKDLNVTALAQKYQEGGASAISVITESKHFMGSLGFIPVVKRATSLPVLRKDFIVDPYELYESRAYGADAVLLIGEMLESAEIEELLAVARTLQLDVLLEVHSGETYEKVVGMKGFLLGINNRNLENMEVDLDRAASLLPLIPPDTPVIVESGIEGREHVQHFAEKGVSGFLIGTSLVLAEDPIKKLKELRGCA